MRAVVHLGRRGIISLGRLFPPPHMAPTGGVVVVPTLLAAQHKGGGPSSQLCVVHNTQHKSYQTDASKIQLGDVATLPELLAAAGREFGSRPSLGTRDRSTGEWSWTSFAERAKQANQCSAFLRATGVRRGDRVAVVSKNRTEWATAAYGTYGAGAAFVPMYEQQPAKDWEYVIGDSEASVLFVSRRDLMPAAMRAAEASPRMKAVVCFDGAQKSTEENDTSTWDGFAECLARHSESKSADVDSADSEDAPTAQDLATLIYTSGTTGKPKGVELTHENLLWNALTIKTASCENLDRLDKARRPAGVRSLSILPWAHIFGQTCELHAMTALGAEVALAHDATTFLDDVASARPTVLVAVPALFNRIFDNFEKTKSHMPPWKRALAERAVALGDRHARSQDGIIKSNVGDYDHTEEVVPEAAAVLKKKKKNTPLSLFESLQLKVLDKLVLSKVRNALGGEVRALGSGGAALDVEVRTFLGACGLPVANGYGLTETSPVLTYEIAGDAANREEGSIGRPLPGVEVRIVDPNDVDDDLIKRDDLGLPDIAASGRPGEIVVSSPGVMRGYWRRPDATDEVLVDDLKVPGKRWFRTGDQGVVDITGSADATPHVRIVGRIKEQFKLANGKYVAPTPIEEHFARSRFVSQVFLYGDNKPFNVALVVPDWTQLEDELCNVKHTDDCPDLKISQPFPFNFAPDDAVSRLANTRWDAIVDLVRKELDSHSVCKNYEAPKKLAILTQGFNVARGMLTPKLSLRRNVVYAAHKDDIDALYAGDADVALVRVGEEEAHLAEASSSSSSAAQGGTAASARSGAGAPPATVVIQQQQQQDGDTVGQQQQQQQERPTIKM